MNKIIFIIGAKRTGTTILRKLIMNHPKVSDLLNEPLELFFACSILNMRDYRNCNYIKIILNQLNKKLNATFYHGAKFALLIGMDAMNWKRLSKVYPKAKFIFITRNIKHSYNSWIKFDKNNIRGIVSLSMYEPWIKYIYNSFRNFNEEQPKSSCIISYENLCKDADKTLLSVWKTLQLNPINGNQQYIKRSK